MKGFVETELWDSVRKITAPTLYVIGGGSRIVPPETQQRLKDTLPERPHRRHAGTGHYPDEEDTPGFHEDRQWRFSATVTAALSREFSGSNEVHMRITRKSFFKLAATGAAGSMLAPADARAAAPKKVEKAAIKGTTDALTAFITKTTLASMPADVVAQARRCLVDGFGVILAGSTVKGSAIVRDYVRTVGDRKEATAIGAGALMTSAAHAALANAASGHAMDYDDTQLSTTPDRTFGLLTHPTVPALAAALAVAERKRASGAAFLEAFLVGFEVECKIAEAIDPDHYIHGFHSSGTIGTFGAAAQPPSC